MLGNSFYYKTLPLGKPQKVHLKVHGKTLLEAYLQKGTPEPRSLQNVGLSNTAWSNTSRNNKVLEERGHEIYMLANIRQTGFYRTSVKCLGSCTAVHSKQVHSLKRVRKCEPVEKLCKNLHYHKIRLWFRQTQRKRTMFFRKPGFEAVQLPLAREDDG